MGILTRPPRAWCLALRACDRRITAAHWVISPEHAMDLDHPGHPYEPIEHEVIIRPHALRKYCGAVRTDSWGEEVEEVGGRLGASRHLLLGARWAGVFSERYVKGLSGKHSRHGIPLIHSWKTLDPSSGRHFSRPDPLWGAMWEYLAEGIAEDFEQTVVRRPVWRWMPRRRKGEDGRRGGWVGKPEEIYGEEMQPEIRSQNSEFRNQNADPRPGPLRESEIRSQNSEFRIQNADPHAGPLPEYRERGEEEQEAGYREMRKDANGDEMQFWGWRWVCPGCKKEVRTIYYPFAANGVFDFLGYDPSRGKSCRTQSKKFLPFDADEVEKPPATFACRACHRVRWTSRVNSEGWNQVVSHLTRGMLYGHEVEKPQWYRWERKNTRCRKLGRVAARREAVFLRLMNGWSYEQIARDLMMSMHLVRENARVIRKQEGVKNRRGLAAKLGWKREQPLNAIERIRAKAKEDEERMMGMILEGLSWDEIGKRTGMKRAAVKEVLGRVYKKHGLGKGEGKRGLGRKFGVELSRYGRGVVHWKRKGAVMV
jgi:DNA-binding CsgD family transcriptional regulator